MKRIGIAASRISKGNSTLYNFFVVLISCLFSIFMFVVVGSTVVFALAIIAYVTNEIMPNNYQRNWDEIRMICIAALAIIVAIFNLMAIFVNFKLPSKFSNNEQ